MSRSSFSDFTSKSSLKVNLSNASGDGDGEKTQQQAVPIGTQFDGNTMQLSTLPIGKRLGRRASNKASEKRIRRLTLARSRVQKPYKSDSCQILNNPYLNFMRDYRLHFGDRFQGQMLVQRAANKWKLMTEKERSLYDPEAYQRGKFTALVENDLDNVKPSATKMAVYSNLPMETCSGNVCPMRPAKRSCRPKVTSKKRKPACRRPKKACKPRKKKCAPKRRKPACRPKPRSRPKPRCRPKKPSCR